MWQIYSQPNTQQWKTKCPIPPLLFKIVLGVLHTVIGQEKGRKFSQVEVKPSLFADDMIQYIKSLKNYPKNIRNNKWIK